MDGAVILHIASMKQPLFMDRITLVSPKSDLLLIGRVRSFISQDLWQTGLQHEQRKLRTCISQTHGTVQS